MKINTKWYIYAIAILALGLVARLFLIQNDANVSNIYWKDEGDKRILYFDIENKTNSDLTAKASIFYYGKNDNPSLSKGILNVIGKDQMDILLAKKEKKTVSRDVMGLAVIELKKVDVIVDGIYKS